MIPEQYCEQELFEEEYYEEEDQEDFRSDYERHPLDSSYYEDARFL